MQLGERVRDAGALLLIAACITAAFWKIALTNQYTFIESPDIGHQVLPWLQVQAAALHRGVVPLWDPYLLGGQPLAGQVQPAVFSPVTWLLWLTPLDRSGHLQLTWLHLWFVLLHVLGGCFAYFFLRDLPARREACVVGAVFFGAAGFVGTTPWPQIAAGAIWLPLVFLFYLRSLRGVRPISSAALAGGFLALSFLSGHHAVPTFAGLAILGVGLAAPILRRAAWTLAAVSTTLTLAIAGLGGAVQIVPAIEYARYAVRWVNATEPVTWGGVVPYPVHQLLAWNASDLLFLILPGANHSIVNPLVGIVPLTLAAVALMTAEKRRGVGLFAGLALGAILFSMARSNVFHGLLYALVPGVEKARAPVMATAVLDVAIAALAAFGVDALLDRRAAYQRRVWIGLGAVAAFLFMVSVYPPPLLQGVSHGADRAAAIALVAAMLGMLLAIWQRGVMRRGVFVAGLLLLALFEIGNSTGYDYVHVEDKASLVRPRLFGDTTDLANFLQGRIGMSRLTYPYDDLVFNFGDWYGIPAMSGFLPSAPEALWRLGTWNPKVLDLYAARYYVAREAPAEGGRQLYQSAGGWKVWEHAKAFPRAWVVHRVQLTAAGEAMVRAVLEPKTDLRETVVLERDLPVESCGAHEEVAVRTPDLQRVEMTVEMQCDGVVVLADNWFPGWQAEVDRRPVEILRADAALRGVPVPRGRHRIAMAYRPASVYWGAASSAAVFLALGALLIAGRFRKRETVR